MTPQPPYPRARHIGALGLSLSALLSPSGKIISSAAAATVLVGGLVTQLPLPSSPAVQATPVSVAPTRLAHNGSSSLDISYIEVDGQPLQVVLAENPTGDSSSVGRGLSSASPVLDLPGGGGNMPGMGLPRTGLRHGAPTLPSPRPSATAPDIPQSSGDPIVSNPPFSAGPKPPAPHNVPRDEPRSTETPSGTPVSAPDSRSPSASSPGTSDPTPRAGSDDPTGQNDPSEAGLPEEGARPDPAHLAVPNAPIDHNDPSEAGAPASPPQEEPLIELLEPFPGNAPIPFEAPESQFPPGLDDPISQLILPSALPEPLTEPSAGQSPSQTEGLNPAAVPEPSMIHLMLLGLAALAWTGRRRLTPTQRA